MSKIKVNEISKHDASEITVNDTVKVDNIAEKTSGAGVTVDGLTIKDTGFDEAVKIKNYTTTQINALSGMSAGDMVYDSDLGTLKVYNGTSWNGMSDSTFQFTVESLVIAGGGGGARNGYAGGGQYRYSGGGGAGGYRNSYASETSGRGSSGESALTLFPSTTYTVTVGAGGAAGYEDTFDNTSAQRGSDSQFNTVVSDGGGGGKGHRGASPYTSADRTDGGSGGGNGVSTGTSNQGYDGGTAGNRCGSGGGGAGGAGANAVDTTTCGAGGVGLSSSIDGIATYRAGGGGGGGNGSAGAGGNGGGGAGHAGSTGTGTAGTANTGGGGGAGNMAAGGAGGSGVVILRYPNDKTITLSAGLTGTTSNVSSSKVTTITAGTGTVSWT